jgi:hypothetical protein
MKEDLSPRLRALGSADFRKGLLGRLQALAVQEAKHLVPRKAGFLDASIRRGALDESHALILAGGRRDVGYAAYIEFGTGIYGPRHRKIVPVHAKMLAWQTGVGGAGGPELRLSGNRRTKGGQKLGGWAFAKSVKGRPATPYLRPGAEAAMRKGGLKEGLVKAWNDAS